MLRLLLVSGLCFIILYPLFMKISVAFRSKADMYDPTVLWIPRHFSLDHIVTAAQSMDYWTSFANSFMLSAGTTMLQWMTCALAAYAFARLRYPGSNFVFMLVIFTIVVPPQTIMIPTYLTFRYFDGFGIGGLLGIGSVNLLDSAWPFAMTSILGMGLKNGLYIYIFRQFFRAIPKELEEAAYVDGCGIGKTFFKIILPNTVPAIVTVMLFSFVWQWNDSYYVSLFFNKIKVLSTQVSTISAYVHQVFDSDPLYVSMILNTGTLLVISPLVIMYFFVQRYFVESVERTGIVGYRQECSKMERRPLYEVIYEQLKQQLEDLTYKPGQQLPTEAELTERFGVSRITVKRALDELERIGYIDRIRGSGSYVKEWRNDDALPNRVMEKMIAFILPSEGASGLSEYVVGAAQELERRGYYLSLHATNENTLKERELLESLPKKGVKGIIFYPINARANIDAVYTLYMSGYPILTIDKYYEGLPIASVVADNFAGGYKAASELLKLGHERIGFVSSVSLESASSVMNRYLGYCQALKEYGIGHDAELVQLDFIAEIGELGETLFYERLVHRYVQLGATALQAENDHVAIKLITAAIHAGLRVPEQLSVVGFDNNELAAHVELPLTTVEQQFKEIGRKAAEMIYEAIENSKPLNQKVEVPVRWVPRDSTAAAELDYAARPGARRFP